MATETIHTPGYEKVIDVTARPLGSMFGQKSHSERCRVCEAPAVLFRKGFRKGQPFAIFAHTLRLYLDVNIKEPKCEYTDLHEHVEPRGH